VARLVIHGGQVVDPASGLSQPRDLIIEGNRIKNLCASSSPAAARQDGDRRIDASGQLVLPGLIDLHVHLREPGQTEAETVASGTRAAAAGGFTTVVCMPNTNPVLDSPAGLARLMSVIDRQALVRVLPAAALSVELKGRRLTPIGDLAAGGAAALSDDGLGTARSSVLAAALRQAADCGLPVLVHCEDRRMTRGGVATIGPVAKKLKLPGIPAAAETEATRRALNQVRHAGGRLHVQHVSTRGALAAVRRAKLSGLPVTCEVTPHHLVLTADRISQALVSGKPDPNLKMNPPLRSERDRAALLEGLKDGTVDAIASDHAPHTRRAKARGFIDAPFGVTGLETTLGLVLGLVADGELSLERAVGLLTCGPARVLGIDSGKLNPGSPADVVVVDPDTEWKVVPSRMRSLSGNTAFGGWTLRGRVSWTIVAGEIVHGS